MLESMTGFGSSEKGGFKVELRSLNHRFLEMFVRMPTGLAGYEMQLRERLKKKVTRGKVDAFITVHGEGSLQLRLNAEAASEVYASLRSLSEKLSVPGEISMDTLLQWKGMFMSEEVSYDAAPLMEAFDEAIEGLKEMRLREGDGLKKELLDIASRIEELNSAVEALYPAAREAAVKKFADNMTELLSEQEVDEGRLLQEAASIGDKIDIAEEIQRTGSHLMQMRGMLDNGGTVGRKLDFLMQELVREANTMASKSSDPVILEKVIEMKSEIERAREQVQNVQ